MNSNKFYLLALGFLSIIIFLSCAKKETPITTSEAVIHKMKSDYKGKWYKNVTFKQLTHYYRADTLNRTETWYEAAKLGKGLVIKFGAIDSGNGILFKNDSMYSFRSDTLINKSFRVHDILELGFNVYQQDASATIDKLKKAGLDFSFFQESETHYLIGDSAKKQAFIEKERMVFSKIESVSGENTARIEFNKYEKLGEGWISPEVLFFANGKMTVKEEYLKIIIPDKLPKGLLNTDDFKAVSW